MDHQDDDDQMVGGVSRQVPQAFDGPQSYEDDPNHQSNGTSLTEAAEQKPDGSKSKFNI